MNDSGPRQQTLHLRHVRRAELVLPPARPPNGSMRITPPAPGVAVLACRCGQVLALADMHRPARLFDREALTGPTIATIRCRRCAAG